MDKNDYIKYWTELRAEVKTFGEVDDLGVIFGSRTEGFGHQYKALPVVPENELVEFERRTGLDLPLEYRTYLQVYGSGGAGPDYGIYDFHTHVRNGDFPDPFPLADAEAGFDLDDDDPAWDLPGLATICSHGCAIESSIELNGPNPGTIWCDSGGVMWNAGSFYDFYRKWADKTRLRIKRYGRLKTIKIGKTWYGSPEKIPFDDIVEIMDCPFREVNSQESGSADEGEIWIYFEETPGKVVLDEQRVLIRIETMMLS